MNATTLTTLPLFERLSGCRRILLAGAGGGFDIFAGIPLFEALRRDRSVFLASLSFSDLKQAGGRIIGDAVEVTASSKGDDSYFPERLLARWYADRGEDVPVYCFKPGGAGPLRAVYGALVRELELDALVLVDGGTDSLMRGDEAGLGTPAEDMCSISAAHSLQLPVKLLVNLGFGIDTFHGVCHAHVLEAIADLSREGGFLGVFSLLASMPEAHVFSEVVDYVCGQMPGRESIVATSVAAALEGRFGNYHRTERTAGSELFINPLMSMYFAFELDAVARRCLYLDYLTDTWSQMDVLRAIHNFLYTIKPREWRSIPL